MRGRTFWMVVVLGLTAAVAVAFAPLSFTGWAPLGSSDAPVIRCAPAAIAAFDDGCQGAAMSRLMWTWGVGGFFAFVGIVGAGVKLQRSRRGITS